MREFWHYPTADGRPRFQQAGPKGRARLLLQGEVALLARGRTIGIVKPGEIFGELAAISAAPEAGVRPHAARHHDRAPGGVFGEMALVDQSVRAADAAAEVDCALLAINRTVFLNLLRTDPTFGASLLGAMAERLRRVAAAVN